MINQLSPLGWILLIGLAAFIVAINIGLFVGAKQKMEKGNWIEKLTAAGEVLKDPLKKENEKYQELSSRVAELKKSDHQIDRVFQNDIEDDRDGKK